MAAGIYPWRSFAARGFDGLTSKLNPELNELNTGISPGRCVTALRKSRSCIHGGGGETRDGIFPGGSAGQEADLA